MYLTISYHVNTPITQFINPDLTSEERRELLRQEEHTHCRIHKSWPNFTEKKRTSEIGRKESWEKTGELWIAFCGEVPRRVGRNWWIVNHIFCGLDLILGFQDIANGWVRFFVCDFCISSKWGAIFFTSADLCNLLLTSMCSRKHTRNCSSRRRRRERDMGLPHTHTKEQVFWQAFYLG